MRRLALLVTVALPAFLGAQAASAARTITPVRGDVRALAFGGDALVVARQPARRGLVVERIVPGASASTILRTRLSDDDDQVSLAASAEALAFAFSPSEGADAAAGVMAGPAAGPLREVATCAAGLLVSPVAVNGSRIAWREGGCGEPAQRPRGVAPSVVAVGGADPAAPLRRSPLPGPGLLSALALGPGDAGLAGLLLPSFFALDSEVRPFGPPGIAAPIVAEQGRAVSPVGILADGTRAFVLAGVEDETGCDTEVFTIAPGSAVRRPISTGGCIATGEYPGLPDAVRTTADRIVLLVTAPPTPTDARAPRAFVVSTRADGSDRRVLARGGYRMPLGVAADGDRSAWWQEACTDGSELVVHDGQDAGTLTVAPCRVEVRTRRARVRDGRIAVRLRCPTGCSGTAYGPRIASRTFSFGRGTHTLRLPVRLGRHPSRRVRFDLAVRNGPPRTASIRVRR